MAYGLNSLWSCDIFVSVLIHLTLGKVNNYDKSCTDVNQIRRVIRSDSCILAKIIDLFALEPGAHLRGLRHLN